MNNDTQEEGGKTTYQHELAARVQAWWNNYEQATSSQNLVKFDWPKILCDFVKQIALDSFKNGVTVGKRKAQATREENTSRFTSVGVKGTALANGKLQPANQPNQK